MKSPDRITSKYKEGDLKVPQRRGGGVRKWAVIGGILLTLLLVAGVVGVRYSPAVKSLILPRAVLRDSPSYQKPYSQRTVADWIVIGAKEEVAKGVRYDADYHPISYPGGDVNPKTGACTDLVIRALRKVGFDLQKLIHEDMEAHFDLYPQIGGLTGPDANIDHRRVPVQMVFFQRFAEELPLEYTLETQAAWRPGDVVCWEIASGKLHTGILSDRVNRKGIPLVIHNAFRTIEDDALLRWKVIGHYRFPKM